MVRWPRLVTAVILVMFVLSSVANAGEVPPRFASMTKEEVHQQYEQFIRSKVDSIGKPLASGRSVGAAGVEGAVWLRTDLAFYTQWWDEAYEWRSTLSALRPVTIRVLGKYFAPAGAIVNALFTMGLAEGLPASAGVKLRDYFYHRDVLFHHQGSDYLAGFSERLVTWRREWAEPHVWVGDLAVPEWRITDQVVHREEWGCHYNDLIWLMQQGQKAYNAKKTSGYYWAFTEYWQDCHPGL